MTVIETLIYDRTQADLARWSALAEKGLSGMTDAELTEWLARMKGAYNATDLNRVGEALLYLADELNGYGYAVTVNAKTDWTEADIPTIQQMQTYLNNVAAIRGVLDVFETTPQTPTTMNKLTFQRANDIEKILADVQAVIEQIEAGFWRANAFTMWAGSEHLPSSRNDPGRTWEELDAMDTNWGNWDAADWFLLLYGDLDASGEYQAYAPPQS